jgi:hypothetical protein
VGGHGVCDHGVVLDDQDAMHAAGPVRRKCSWLIMIQSDADRARWGIDLVSIR